MISTVVPDSPHKIFIGGLPNYLNEDQVNIKKKTVGKQHRICKGLTNITTAKNILNRHRIHFIV